MEPELNHIPNTICKKNSTKMPIKNTKHRKSKPDQMKRKDFKFGYNHLGLYNSYIMTEIT